MEKTLKSISADGSSQLTKVANELGLKREDIVSIVWLGDHLSLFYYD